jgi:hypothetical protein
LRARRLIFFGPRLIELPYRFRRIRITFGAPGGKVAGAAERDCPDVTLIALLAPGRFASIGVGGLRIDGGLARAWRHSSAGPGREAMASPPTA